MSKPHQNEIELRPHSYDGIQEYDQRLPNWWLMTLYGAIAFSVGYWVFYHQLGVTKEAGVAIEQEIKANQVIAARASGVLSNDVLWGMSHDNTVVASGKTTFETMCASCHLPTLMGAIGPNLRDTAWIHGGQPMDIIKTVTVGVLEKGMPTWGPVLGQTKIAEVSAYILSYHQSSEVPTQAPPWVPGAPPPPPAP